MTNTHTLDLIALNVARAQRILSTIEEDVTKLARELDTGVDAQRQQPVSDLDALDAAIDRLAEGFSEIGGMSDAHAPFVASYEQ